ncbi:DUF6571 family protein [Streptomyces sp. SID3343]|uniref:DUF6571 family protein n=1 Tax=Streptomyces sp. SID3343 TaxID=2690260 RepID=UPI00136DFA2D|nr:DUF6571 family protein [Streptomyces sp. SID3343]MYW04990.1 hypothetical protein [Streptomyces sp. SID3343]
MVTTDQLRELRTEALLALADNWDRLQRALDGDRDRARQEVLAPLDSASWEGRDAKRAIAALQGNIEQLEAARIEAGAVASVIRDAAQDLRVAQDVLVRAEEEARANGIRVMPDGALSWEASTDVVHEVVQRVAQDVGPRIAEALRSAADADSRAAWALRADVDFAGEKVFNSHATGAGPAADAMRAEQLLADVGTLNTAQLAELANLLHANSGDPAFTEPLMTAVGPEGLLAGTKEIAETAQKSKPGDPALASLKLLQVDLGKSLANASPKLVANPQWMAALREASREQIPVAQTSGYVNHANVYGFQMLGVLLNNGTYDPAFLKSVAEDTLAFEQKNGKPPVWSYTLVPPPAFPLNLTGSPGEGFDPMTGIMSALSRDPATANDFFSSHGDSPERQQLGLPNDSARERLDYLLNGRETWADARPPSAAAPSAYLDAAGGALQVATTGATPGTQVPPHTEKNADLMNEVVSLYGSGSHRADIPPELQDSIANSLTSYISDVHSTLGRLAGTDPLAPFPGTESGASAAFNKQDLANVIYGVSHDPKAAAQLMVAEQAYSTAGLDRMSYRDDPQGTEVAWRATAQTMGFFNAAQNAAASDLSVAADASYNHDVLWQSKELYHGPGFFLNLLPGGWGDLAQRGMNMVADYWGESQTTDHGEEVRSAAAERNGIFENYMGNAMRTWAERQNADEPVPQISNVQRESIAQAVNTQIITGRDSLKFEQGYQ